MTQPKLIKHPLPFQIGDKAIAHATVQASYGYESALPAIEVRASGVEVHILAIDYYAKRSHYPDALVTVGEETFHVDICYLTPIADVKPVVKTAGAAKKLTPQCTTILKHLTAGHSITHRSALMDFGVMSLPRRICDLKEMGHKIKSIMEHNTLTGQRYARYSIA
jgi:hypothetical protein